MALKDFLKAQAGQFVDSAVNKALGGILGGSPEQGSGFNVNNLVSALNKSGFMKSSLFEVYIHGGKASDERDMAMRVESIDLPGRSFTLTDHKFTNIGPLNKMPSGQIYSDVTASILLSEDLREKDYFEYWQNKIMNTGAYEGYGNAVGEQEQMLREQEEGLTRTNANYVASPFGFKYFDNFIGRVEIRSYSQAGELKSIHTLNEAYPISIAPIGMNWASEEAAKLQVTFAYKNYTAVFNKQDQPGLGFGFNFSMGKDGLKLAARLPEIGNMAFSGGGVPIIGDLAPLQKKVFKSIGL